MEERSKTNKEIYEEKYPTKELEETPMECAEALGYLRALIQYFPGEIEWAEIEMVGLFLRLIFFSL